MKLAALAAVLGALMACTAAPDPLDTNTPRVEQVQPASFNSASGMQFKAVDDGTTYMKDLYKEVALDRDRRARASGITQEIDQWRVDDQVVTDFYLTGRTPDTLRSYMTDLAKDDPELTVPAGREVVFGKITPLLWRTYLVHSDAALDATHLTNAAVTLDPETDRTLVTFNFTADGTRLFGEVTARISGHKLAVLVDGHVASAPVIQGRIEGGRAQVTFASDDEAKTFVDSLSL
jgi:preprotein translocase subunit SecD